MIPIRNGMSARLVGAVADSSPWRKSSYSGRVGNCVEFARLPDEQVAVRNSRDPNGPALVASRGFFAALVATAKTW
ncbi:MAG: DUF397 domain-containing protein [Labedaea sp.]